MAGDDEREWREDEQRFNINDSFDMDSEFLLEPNINKYGLVNQDHINKNIVLTNLNRRDKEHLSVQTLLGIVTVLKRFKVWRVGMNEAGQEIKVVDYRFRELIEFYSTKIYGITATAAGSNGKLLEALQTRHVHRDQTIEDRTEPRGIMGRAKRGGRGDDRQ